MSVWKFIATAPNMGERIVPAPHDPSGSGNALIKRTGTWIHEKDWLHIKSLQFPCRGIMKDGFAKGCPDAKTMATIPPEPPVAPPPAFFEVPTVQAPKPKGRGKKAVQPQKLVETLLDHYPDSSSTLDDIP